mgnify:CR=1 FL=1
MNFQWYPGHMTKAKRMMQENITFSDIGKNVIFILYAILRKYGHTLLSLNIYKTYLMLLSASSNVAYPCKCAVFSIVIYARFFPSLARFTINCA